MQCNAIQYNSIQCNTIQYNTRKYLDEVAGEYAVHHADWMRAAQPLIINPAFKLNNIIRAEDKVSVYPACKV